MQPDWEIWLDSHFSPVIAKWLNEATGLNVKSSFLLQINGKDDLEIYELAKKAGNVILISKDSDFAEIILLRGAPPKLINIKIGNCTNKEMFGFLNAHINRAVRLLTSFEMDIFELE